MSRKGWKPLRRKTLPLLSKSQRKAPLVFARTDCKLTADEWEDILFSDEYPKYLFLLPNPKNDIVWSSQESQVLPSCQIKESAKSMVCGGNFPNFIQKEELPVNSPYVNPIETLWTIIDDAAHKDPIPKTMGGIKSRLRQAWQNIPLGSLIRGASSFHAAAAQKRYTEQ